MNNIVRNNKPLIINITNRVTINDIANVLTTIGASPIMTNEQLECEELISLAKLFGGCLVVNIGTLDLKQIELIKVAVKAANEASVKVILDPVGAGASKLRTDTCIELLTDYKIDIVRGNASEISSLVGSELAVKGVDSDQSGTIELASGFATEYQTTVLISGQRDVLADCDKAEVITGGSKYLPQISGTGCMLTAIIGAYASHANNYEAAKQGLNHVLQASERAELDSDCIIDFKHNWFKQLELISYE